MADLSTNRQPYAFEFESIRVFFKHTDAFGYVHPYNYLEWTSYAREAFFQSTVPNFREVLERPIKMMTARISSRHVADGVFGDHIVAYLSVGKIRKVSFEMIVRFHRRSDDRLLCETSHMVVFMDFRSGDLSDIPEEIMKVIRPHHQAAESQT